MTASRSAHCAIGWPFTDTTVSPFCIPAFSAARPGMIRPATAGVNGPSDTASCIRRSTASAGTSAVTVRPSASVSATALPDVVLQLRRTRPFHESTGCPFTAVILSPTLQRAERLRTGRHPAESTTPDDCDRIDGLAVLERQAAEDEPREQRVHGDAGQDDDHPLPHRLRLEHAIGRHLRLGRAALECGARGFLLLARHLHVAAEREPRQRIFGFAALEREAGDRRADADGEAVHPDARPLGGGKVTELVDEDEHAEGDGEREQCD